MKTLIATLALAGLVSSAMASGQNPEVAALRDECAAQVAQKHAKQSQDGNTFVYVYHKGQLKGEATGGAKLACSEAQYVAFLETADPDRVASAYPTAAGRPGAKAKKPVQAQPKP
jgi:hypothetical protein